MGDTDESPALPRLGSTADLARRMDRIESRQDTAEDALNSLSATVQRVAQNQEHSVELNKLRFDSLDASIKAVTIQFTAFALRFEGILSGEVETQQGRQGRELVDEYQRWRRTVDDRLDGLKDKQDVNTARIAGRMDTLTWGKTLLLAATSLVGGAITVLTILNHH